MPKNGEKSPKSKKKNLGYPVFSGMINGRIRREAKKIPAFRGLKEYCREPGLNWHGRFKLPRDFKSLVSTYSTIPAKCTLKLY
jgi:hypothetical protein